MNNTYFLLSKDCLPVETLPCYSASGAADYWRGKMPNMNELAKKGTVFRRHYTAAPSTSMSMSAMLTGRYPYEFSKRKHYVRATPSEFPSIFDTLQQQGYECHMIWDKTWIHMAWRFVREFGDESKTIFHNLDIAQATAGHKPGDEKLRRNDELLKETLRQIDDTLNSIDFTKKQFVWMHLPHILKGRRSYQDDLDVFDEIIGKVRHLVGDDNIFLTSDHGHMNMHKHKLDYGFDVYEPAIRIPLITPRINGLQYVDDITSNADLPQLMLQMRIPNRECAIADTKYYAQPKRKLSVVGKRYKYIFNAEDSTEELYDLEWDAQEDYNILEELFFDDDRNRRVFSIEKYFYPYYDEAMVALKQLRSIKNGMWKTGSPMERLYVRLWTMGVNIKKSLHG